MNHPTLMSELARAHQHELLRGAVRQRLTALARCCKPSNLRAALATLFSRQRPVVDCCA